MVRKTVSIAMLGGVLASTGCIGVLHGDGGPMTSQTVSQTGYTEIDLRGSADLIVKIGPEESIQLDGNEDRVENVDITVEDGVLVIREDGDGLFGHSNGDLTITVTAPSITSVKLSGSGDIDITGAHGESFAAAINGSGDIDVSGEVDSATLTIRGSGDIAAKGLKAKSVEVSISGSGDADVFASDSIDALIRGSGDITYYGGATKVKDKVQGSGDISAGK
ncbi:MAG: DUF2807 domain-containing protein [Armatimonadetes bacterium]|nr:DUF2807 domain-containing protein [Armatimonadota bacterium]